MLFDAKEKDATKLAIALRKAIEKETSIDCAVVFRTSKELAATVAKNPFPDDCEHVHVVFMELPSEVAFDGAKYAPEEIAIVGRDVYLHLPNGVGRSKLAADVAPGRSSSLAPRETGGRSRRSSRWPASANAVHLARRTVGFAGRFRG